MELRRGTLGCRLNTIDASNVTCRERDADTVEFFPTTTPFPRVSTDDYLRQVATNLVDILRAPKNNIPSLTYGSPTTNAYIHIAQILKLAATPPTPVPSVHHDIHPPRVTPVFPSVTKERRVVPAKKHIKKTILQKHVASEPRVEHKTTRHHTIPLRHRHPVVQNKQRLLGRLRSTKSRLTRLVKTAINNSHFQSQSVQNVEDYQGHWACPVYHLETGHNKSLDALFRGQQSLTQTTSLTNDIGRLAQGIGKNRPAHKKL